MSLASVSARNQKLAKYDQTILDEGGGPLAGVDEAGRGPLAGPVVATVVIVKDPSFSVRIDDSKKLTPRARELAFEEIMKKCVVSSAMRAHDHIDKINIYRATIESMEEAVECLPEKPRLVMVDGLMPLKIKYPLRKIVGGDGKSLAVACASIAAKVIRDRLMLTYHARYPQYGFDQHKGYGTSRHLSALQTHGPCAIHRRSFEPLASVTKNKSG